MSITGKIIAAIGMATVGLSAFGLIKKPSSVYKNSPSQKNPMEGKKVIFISDKNEEENADGVRGHLEAVGDADRSTSFYDRAVKRMLDIVLSLCGLIILAPIFLVVCIAIVIDDPGPVFFAQKRVGRNKQFFRMHKFRSMKMSTPHDVPTHMLENPEAYITRVGKILRKYSLDELPQIWDIFMGDMSVIGPRPALWNQNDLVAERDKYGANDVKPGLTGLAQISGRDELEIEVKAQYDGEYVQELGKDNISGIKEDVKCFIGTIASVAKHEGVVEGGTGRKED